LLTMLSVLNATIIVRECLSGAWGYVAMLQP
jgi:hypothetical protein